MNTTTSRSPSVPSVAGLGRRAAAKKLTRLGFKVGEVEQFVCRFRLGDLVILAERLTVIGTSRSPEFPATETLRCSRTSGWPHPGWAPA